MILGTAVSLVHCNWSGKHIRNEDRVNRVPHPMGIACRFQDHVNILRARAQLVVLNSRACYSYLYFIVRCIARNCVKKDDSVICIKHVYTN